MLRRKLTDTTLLDEVDLTLLAAVEAGLSSRALLESASCAAEEAQLRILRLIQTGHLEDTPDPGSRSTTPPRKGRTPSAHVEARGSAREQNGAARTVDPALAGPTATRASAPSSPSEPSSQGKTVPPSARAARDALLRELFIRRASSSHPPVRVSEPAAPIASGALPGYYSMRPGGPASEGVGGDFSAKESEASPAAITRAPPGRYSMSKGALTGAPSSAPPERGNFDFDSPLAALIHEFSGGQERERWCAARLRAALHEELSGNVQQAISTLEAILTQVSDPRIRAERDRLQSRSLKATSGVYRSRALLAERADKHKEAVESWRKVLEAFPDDAEATLHAAKCSLEMGDLKQASMHARRAVELAPDSVAAHKLLLRFFRKTGMEHNANREREILRRLAKR
jgi:hypothetical protein